MGVEFTLQVILETNILFRLVVKKLESQKKRGRPRRATDEQIAEINRGLQQLGIGESIEDFAQQFVDEGKRKNFAANLASQIQVSQQLAREMAHNGTIQPLLSQDLYQKLNINPIVATSGDIERWTTQPQKFALQLRGLSQYLAYAVGNYNRAIYYFNTIKSFNYELLPCDIPKDKSDKKDYINAYNRCLDTLKKMNIKYQFPKIDLQTMFDGVATYWINEYSDGIQFQQLPSDWVYLTAPWEFGYQATFDLTYFDQYIGLDIAIPELYQAYLHFVELRKNGLRGKKLSDGELTVVQYYPLPIGKHWVFTFDPIHPDAVPPLTSSMGAALDTLSYKKLLKDKLALDLYKVIALKIPMKKDDAKMSITYAEASEITQVIQSQLPDNIRVYSSPFDSDAINTSQVDKFDDIIKISNESFNTSAGVQQGLFGGSDLRQSMALTVSSNVDFAYTSTHMYSQFANCVNFLLRQKSKAYKFVVRFSGNALRKDEEIKLYGEQMASRNAPASIYFSALGYEPFEIEPLLRLENELGWKDLMKPLTSMFQVSAKTNPSREGVGRKKLDETEISDSGSETKAYRE